jgi:hypothetical protein
MGGCKTPESLDDGLDDDEEDLEGMDEAANVIVSYSAFQAEAKAAAAKSAAANNSNSGQMRKSNANGRGNKINFYEITAKIFYLIE